MSDQTTDTAPVENTGAIPAGGSVKATARTKTRKHHAKRRDLYQDVTDTIIAELEQGRVPWVQPWGLGSTALGLPTNAHTARTYSGINILLLWSAALDAIRPHQTWLTFKQALALGGNVRKGERGTTVVYADTFTPKEERERAARDGNNPQAIGFLKRYTVFNIDQCEGLSADLYKNATPMPERELIPHAEALIEATGADFRIGGNRAFFVPAGDYIQVPHQQTFFEQINYYRTCFHELGHWTGHTSRLDRYLATSKGSKDYAREELVAEMASAFVCASLNIVPTVRHADYIASWLEVLKNDNRAIFRAASLASKATDYILAFQNTEGMEAAA